MRHSTETSMQKNADSGNAGGGATEKDMKHIYDNIFVVTYKPQVLVGLIYL